MKKLKALTCYECVVSFKYIWFFYGILYGITAIVTAIVFVATGGRELAGSNGLEFSSMIYMGVMAGLGSRDDFKMMIQNGFTRTYIFLSTFSGFAFIAAVMAAIDTAAGNLMHGITGYHSVFGFLYGYGRFPIFNWSWLFFLYLLVSCLVWLIVLGIRKIGKTASLIGGFSLIIVLFVMVPALFQFVLPAHTVAGIVRALARMAGFLGDGRINLAYPLLTMAALITAAAAGTYQILKRTELHI